MILKETILSAFTERGTLLKWLKKVEAALNNAVLTDIAVEQVSATQVKLKFTFENGDFVESPVLTLPRGEKGEKGENGKDGLDGEGIAATIEVGTVTTGAAGTNASVTNVGTEQRAILNFVIPRGDTGASGAEGSAGVGFDDASRIEQNSGTNTLTAGTNGLTIAATFKVTAGDEVFEIPSSMFLAVKGSESIVIDVDESGTFFDIHLDADIVTKLSRVLVTPMSAPASVSLVAVDTSNAQTMLTLGDGLSVSGGVLSASGGGGGGGIVEKTIKNRLYFNSNRWNAYWRALKNLNIYLLDGTTLYATSDYNSIAQKVQNGTHPTAPEANCYIDNVCYVRFEFKANISPDNVTVDNGICCWYDTTSQASIGVYSAGVPLNTSIIAMPTSCPIYMWDYED